MNSLSCFYVNLMGLLFPKSLHICDVMFFFLTPVFVDDDVVVVRFSHQHLRIWYFLLVCDSLFKKFSNKRRANLLFQIEATISTFFNT